ncbi:MAG: hypothetical protein KIC66_01905 [Clostridium sp.]|uniref:hypothetical protein n=1 Tax=Clostridium sp. TaxID=1506 RepID=UPI0025BE7E3D|nr:hypothetical protein [Clostridium sp.]MBS5925829.1 hypothetical protein [Clostridium sp.]
MAHNKLYRNFIILQEDEKTHAASGEKALSGYAKIEAKGDKCKISFYAQNLKKEEKYSILLICYKKDMKQIVDLGVLEISDIGKGEASKEYYVNNIAGLDFSYDKISGAAICKYVGGELTYLMYGFMNGENVGDSWKKCKVLKHIDKNKENIEVKEVKEVKKEVKKVEEVKCVEPEHKEHHEEKEHKDNHEDKCKDEMKDKCKKDDKDYHEEVKKKEKHDECKEDHHKEKKEDKEDKCEKINYCDQKYTENMGCMGACKKRDAIESEEYRFDEYEAQIVEEKELDPYDFEMRGSLGEFFENIVKDFEEVKNKFKEIKYCKWYKVNIKSLDDMCNISNYNKYTIAYYPMLNYYPYIKKYGYFMLGYKCDKKGNLKYIVYGVPGKKDKDEQPYAGKTGFVTWMSGDKDKEGCWLMFYDYKNSTVVVPMK